MITTLDALRRSAIDFRPSGAICCSNDSAFGPSNRGYRSAKLGRLEISLETFLKNRIRPRPCPPMPAHGDREISLVDQMSPNAHQEISVSESE